MNSTAQGDNATENLLWTGGWDSTFRLLERLFIERATTKPWYIIDTTRQSLSLELRRMARLGDRIRERLDDPGLLKPTRFVLLNDIPEDPEVSRSFAELRQKARIGEQYEWLAKFARFFDLREIEVGWPLHIETPPIYTLVFKRTPDGELTGELEEDNAVQTAFGFYRFPIINRTKASFLDTAQRNGFDDILEATWFCHRPIRGQACGVCNPCRQAREQGRDLSLSRLSPFIAVTRRVAAWMKWYRHKVAWLLGRDRRRQ